MNDEAPTSGSGETTSTPESDTGQGAGEVRPGETGPGGPERRSGRVVMRRDAAARMGKPAQTEDEQFLERRPPPGQAPDFLDSDPWRALRILSEFVEGFDALATVGPAVTVFGSARVAAGAPEYELARSIARRLAESGFAIITGGGPGIMEAANRGCREGGGLSIGCNIELPAALAAAAGCTASIPWPPPVMIAKPLSAAGLQGGSCSGAPAATEPDPNP